MIEQPPGAKRDLLVNDLRALLASVAALEAEREAERREVGEQMASKLEAQMALAAITEAVNLRLDQIGNGWTEGARAILARIEEIVDQAAWDAGRAERAEADNKQLREALEAVSRHLEDCCRTDIGLGEALRSHDSAVRAVIRDRAESPV